jgi:hypothetical protein
MISVMVALLALLGAAALATDGGMIFAARTQLQNSADAAALAAAGNMIDLNATPPVTLAAGEAAAIAIGSNNSAGPEASITIANADITFGFWDTSSRQLLEAGEALPPPLSGTVDLSDPSHVTGARVLARLDGTTNGVVPAFFGRVLGTQGFDVRTDATAYLGYAGKVGPGEVDLPIAIDCCGIAGPNCDNYCPGGVAPTPNFGANAPFGSETGCFITQDPVLMGEPMTCLDLAPTGDQIACWINFDDASPSVSTPDLTAIVADGSPDDVSAGDFSYIDNGDKTPVVRDIHDKFYGDPDSQWASNPAGIDTNEAGSPNPTIDSWYVGLPVIECQTGDHCAKGDPDRIEGFVCFRIREVITTPDKRIKGRFICPDTQEFKDNCDFGTTGSGGGPFGPRADIPVLVE